MLPKSVGEGVPRRYGGTIAEMQQTIHLKSAQLILLRRDKVGTKLRKTVFRADVLSGRL